MNNKQALVLIAGLTLGFLVGLCPPRVLKEAPSVRASRGFLFSSSLYLHPAYDPVTNMGTSSTSYSIDNNRLVIEWSILAMGVAAIFVACRTWENKKA